MVGNRAEYQAMFQVEAEHWWYRSLHRKVWDQIISLKLDLNKIKVLDAGCGTGGFLLTCKEKGLHRAEGFDYSSDAVDFCIERGLNVKELSILDLKENYPADHFDLIVNNDVLCQFEQHEIVKILNGISHCLKPGGYFISNNQAHPVFKGTHDIAVGAVIRFLPSDFENYLQFVPKLMSVNSHFWSVTLSPLILAARFFQRLQLKFNKIDLKNIESDVKPSSFLVSKLFYNLIILEDKIPFIRVFGSSLFQVFKKKE